MANSSDVKIVVLGVGGGGSNAVNNMIAEAGNSQLKFVVVNTDAQDLEKSIAPNKILISTKNKKNEGLGAGAKPEVGTDAAENTLDEIRTQLQGADIVFIAAGMGGGTGSGAAHVIARCAKEELDITTVAVVTKPFSWEGNRRAVNAQKALENLKSATDALIEIPNDRVVDMSSKKTPLSEAFKAADNVLKDGVLGITDLITKTGLINLDFADLQSIVKDAGTAHMGIGLYKQTEEESNPALKALLNAIESPLLETNITGAKRVIINYVSNEELSMLDISEANQMVHDMADGEVNLIWGAATDENLAEGEVKVTVIAAEFNNVADNNINNGFNSSQNKQTNGMVGSINNMVGNMDNMKGNQNVNMGGINNPFARMNNMNGFGGNNLGVNQNTMNSQFGTANINPGQNNNQMGTQNGFANVPREFNASRFQSLFGNK